MATTVRVSLAQLEDVAPAREAVESDAVEGVLPAYVVRPESIEQAAEVMRFAHANRLVVCPRGSGSKLGWGGVPQRVDLIVDMAGMNRVLEHADGDLIAVTEAGTRLAALNEIAGRTGQRLMLDSYQPDGTLAGTIAANASGPRRLRFGTMRDLLIGITVVLADGTVAKAGGKVVKNVAGYDLGKLFTGSMGTLGLIVQAVVRLHAVPEARRLVTVDVGTADAAGRLVLALKASTLVPIAIELDWSGGRGTVFALFEGVEPGVEDQAERAARLASEHGQAEVVASERVDDIWQPLATLPWEEGDVGLKIIALPASLPALLKELDPLSSRGVRTKVRGQAATSVLYASLSGEEGAMPAALGDLRNAARRARGSLVVLQAPAELKRTIDVWGPVGDALPLMQRVKGQFDPAGTMSPGRFVGGI